MLLYHHLDQRFSHPKMHTHLGFRQNLAHSLHILSVLKYQHEYIHSDMQRHLVLRQKLAHSLHMQSLPKYKHAYIHSDMQTHLGSRPKLAHSLHPRSLHRPGQNLCPKAATICDVVCMYVCVCIYIYTYIYIYMRKHIQRDTDTRTHMHGKQQRIQSAYIACVTLIKPEVSRSGLASCCLIGRVAVSRILQFFHYLEHAPIFEPLCAHDYGCLCVCVCVCVCVCMYICMYMYIYIYLYTYIYTHDCMIQSASMHEFIFTRRRLT